MDADRIEIQTPEGFNLELTLAGLGSRAAAAIIDTLIIAAVAIVVMLPFRGQGGSLVMNLIIIALPISLFFGYHLAFETIGRRQSPGKRLLRLRIVRTDGSPAGGVAALIRNLVRIVDFLPAFYLIGMVTVFSTTQNQRLGDLAAGVVVMMEPKRAATPTPTWPEFAEVPEGWDVSAVTDEDIAMMREFLSRREKLDADSRRQIGFRIADAIERKISHPAVRMTSEQTIETVLRLKEARG
ncbi:MAG: RDD family protein [Acidimicrobiia bacterium]|nr:RDD family protein [Acidimicrobiia bacterium]